ncbi:MAG: NUDIX domain-containing protein [Chlamydiota bacterium]
MNVNNFVDVQRNNLIIDPFRDGAQNIVKAFSPNETKWDCDSSKNAHIQRKLNLVDRVELLAAGAGLLIPVINIVIYYAFKHFGTIALPVAPTHTQQTSHTPTLFSASNHARKTSHTGAGVLPYCIQNGEVYFLLSKEGFGSDAHTWCDFGGAKDRGETALQTAARECWEESRGILGDQNSITQSIANAPSLGNRYIAYLMPIDQPSHINNALFQSKVFSDFCRMEKTDIAWVRAADVFNAARGDRSLWINHSKERMRGFFADILRNAENSPAIQALFRSAAQSQQQCA